MKKVYMRAGISPTDNFDPAYAILQNSIGNNVGNLIYAYGMFRTLSTERTSVEANYYKASPKNADQINEEYSSFVIPLADAFRPDFVPELRKMTQLISKLSIPCIVAGVGLRAPFEPGADIHFSYDEDVKAFIKAVLEKSGIVGVRGEITGSYLAGLGFQEDKDYMVIGCPSMYTFGRNLPIKDVNLSPQSKISINSSVLSPALVHKFLEKTMKQIPDHYFLPQRLQELKLLYLGQPYVHNQENISYPSQITDDIYKADRVKFFLRASEWIDFLKTVDLSVGGRMHGNITAAIAGTPSILIPHDARMRELTNYHKLTHIWANEITETTDIFELAAKLDFQQVSREHGKNFDRFVDFLNKNDMDHIYKKDLNTTVAPLDKIMKKGLEVTSVSSIVGCSLEEMAQRWMEYYPGAEAKTNKMKSEIKSLNNKIQKLKKKKLSDLQCETCDMAGDKTKGTKVSFLGKKYEIRRVYR